MIPMKKWSVYEQELWEMGSQVSRETGFTGQTYGSQSGYPPGYDNRSHASSPSVNGGDYDYYRNTNMSEKPRNGRRSSAFTSGTASATGSEYGGFVTPMIPMNDFNHNMMATPPPGMFQQQFPMRPMSYTSTANPEFMSPMVDPRNPYFMSNQSAHMSGSFDTNPRRSPSPAFNNRARNTSYDVMSNYSVGNLPNSDQQTGYDIPMGNVSQMSLPPMIPPGFPSDEEILAEIKSILATANLMSITKKQGTKIR
jgi:chitin synthase